MKTYILNLIALAAIILSSCTEEELSLKSTPETPSSIIIDDFDENDELRNTTTYTYSDSTLTSVLWEYAESTWSSSDLYTYQNGIVQMEKRQYATESEYTIQYFYDTSGRIIRKELTNAADTMTYVYEYEYVSDNHIIDLINNREFFLSSTEPFQIEKIVRESYQQIFNYTDGVVSSIEHQYGGELYWMEEFEYLNREVSESYNKSRFLYGPQWKLNTLLLEGYSHQIEERYVTRHSALLNREEEWTFTYEFDSLDRVSNQYLKFEDPQSSFSCMTYYNY